MYFARLSALRLSASSKTSVALRSLVFNGRSPPGFEFSFVGFAI
jgi:hypothetical protein